MNILLSMNQFDQSINNLKNLYDVSEPYYLSTFFGADGPVSFYNFLTSVYQAEYQNNFRILIVQDCADVHDYQDLPGHAICTFQNFLNQL